MKCLESGFEKFDANNPITIRYSKQTLEKRWEFGGPFRVFHRVARHMLEPEPLVGVSSASLLPRKTCDRKSKRAIKLSNINPDYRGVTEVARKKIFISGYVTPVRTKIEQKFKLS